MAEVLKSVVIEPNKPADASIIWLHGLGADGYDFVDVVPSLGLGLDHAIRFIFPHAPNLAVTINGGMVMPAWYDIAEINMDAKQDEAGIKKSEKDLRQLLSFEIEKNIPSTRILLIGFSQGGAMALHTALRLEYQLGGVGALSAYLPLHSLLLKERNTVNNKIPIFMAHGFADEVVPYQLGEHSCRYLQTLEYPLSFHRYSMGHSVCLPEINDIGKWIKQILGL